MNTTRAYPRPQTAATNTNAIGHAGGVLLTETARATGLDVPRSDALSPVRKRLSRHDPGRVVLDAALSLALGGDALADIDTLRAEPSVYGQVASDPTISRTITALAGDITGAEAAINADRQTAREAAWSLAGPHAPSAARSARAPLVIDLDATLITAHSETESAAATFKRGFGFHPLTASVDHGPGGTGDGRNEPPSRQCRVKHRHRPHRRHTSRARAGPWHQPVPGAARRSRIPPPAQGPLRRSHP